jgi:hypothetical protein
MREPHPNKIAPIVREGRIYVNLGDKFPVDFGSVGEMRDMLRTLKRIYRRGSVPGSTIFNAEGMAACARRIDKLKQAIQDATIRGLHHV